MKLNSIQMKIAVWSGLCLLATASVIVAFSAWNMRKAANAQRLKAIKAAKQLAAASAGQKAGYVQAQFEGAMDVARTLAETFSGIKDDRAKLKLDRDALSNILKIILERNPNFIGTYTAWEPGKLDGLNDLYKGTEGYDQTGRFIPYFNRNEQGKIVMEPLIDYENEGAGDYYQLPKKTKTECIIDPYVYPVQGKPTLLTSLVVPIMVGETFYGIAGVNLRLDFLQEIADDVKDLYDGAAKIVIISHNGTIVAATNKPELQGKHLKEVYENFEKGLSIIQAGKSEIITNEKSELEVYMPLKTGKSKTPWSIKIIIPEKKITFEADEQMHMANINIWKMTAISIACALAALILLWFAARGISRPILKVVEFADLLKAGDLTTKLQTGKDEIGRMGSALNAVLDELKIKALAATGIANGDLRQDINVASDKDELGKALYDMTKSLNDIVGKLQTSIAEVNAGSRQVSDSSQSLSQGATEQAASLEEITSSMTEIGSQTKTNAENATQANQFAKNASESSSKGTERMENMVAAMGKISESSEEIGKIIKVIDDIAFQTNLLALNAAVEAARAGKHGKGFAVVAQEVRTLAARSAKAAQETADLIEGSIKQVEEGNSVAESTAKALDEINEGISKVSDLTGEIAAASNEQAQGISQVNQGLSQVDSVTQQNTANAEETASAAEELSSQAAMIRGLIARFKLKGKSGMEVSHIEYTPAETVQPADAHSTRSETSKDSWGQKDSILQTQIQHQSVNADEVIQLDDNDFGRY